MTTPVLPKTFVPPAGDDEAFTRFFLEKIVGVQRAKPFGARRKGV